MNYVGMILAVLEGVSRFVGYLQDKQKLDEGELIQIAKASAEIMRKSQYAKQALTEFNAKSDADVDDFLRNLGGPGGGAGSGDSK